MLLQYEHCDLQISAEFSTGLGARRLGGRHVAEHALAGQRHELFLSTRRSNRGASLRIVLLSMFTTTPSAEFE